MKTSTFIIVIFVSILQLNAQNTVESIRYKIDSAFMYLDQQYIPTGILLDKAVAVPNDIDRYLTVNDSVTDFYKWRSLYKAMRFGSFISQAFISEDSINKILQANREADVIPLFFLDYNYNSMKYYALDSNLIYS